MERSRVSARNMDSFQAGENNSVYQSSVIVGQDASHAKGIRSNSYDQAMNATLEMSERMSESDSGRSRSNPVSPGTRRRILKEPFSTAGKLHGQFHEDEEDRNIMNRLMKKTQQVHFKNESDEFDEVLNDGDISSSNAAQGSYLQGQIGTKAHSASFKPQGVTRNLNFDSSHSQSGSVRGSPIKQKSRQLAPPVVPKKGRGRGRNSDHLPGEFEIGKSL